MSSLVELRLRARFAAAALQNHGLYVQLGLVKKYVLLPLPVVMSLLCRSHAGRARREDDVAASHDPPSIVILRCSSSFWQAFGFLNVA